MYTNFKYPGALEDVVTKWVDLSAAWAKWCVSCGVKWEAEFAFQADIEDPWWHPVGWLAVAGKDDGGQRAQETAVRYPSQSAARWALLSWPEYVDWEFCVRCRTSIAEFKRYSMSPENVASILSRMDAWMNELLHWCRLDGAKINMSRWRRSHQKGADVSTESVLV